MEFKKIDYIIHLEHPKSSLIVLRSNLDPQIYSLKHTNDIHRTSDLKRINMNGTRNVNSCEVPHESLYDSIFNISPGMFSIEGRRPAGSLGSASS